MKHITILALTIIIALGLGACAKKKDSPVTTTSACSGDFGMKDGVCVNLDTGATCDPSKEDCTVKTGDDDEGGKCPAGKEEVGSRCLPKCKTGETRNAEGECGDSTITTQCDDDEKFVDGECVPKTTGKAARISGLGSTTISVRAAQTKSRGNIVLNNYEGDFTFKAEVDNPSVAEAKIDGDDNDKLIVLGLKKGDTQFTMSAVKADGTVIIKSDPVKVTVGEGKLSVAEGIVGPATAVTVSEVYTSTIKVSGGTGDYTCVIALPDVGIVVTCVPGDKTDPDRPDVKYFDISITASKLGEFKDIKISVAETDATKFADVKGEAKFTVVATEDELLINPVVVEENAEKKWAKAPNQVANSKIPINANQALLYIVTGTFNYTCDKGPNFDSNLFEIAATPAAEKLSVTLREGEKAACLVKVKDADSIEADQEKSLPIAIKANGVEDGKRTDTVIVKPDPCNQPLKVIVVRSAFQGTALKESEKDKVNSLPPTTKPDTAKALIILNEVKRGSYLVTYQVEGGKGDYEIKRHNPVGNDNIACDEASKCRNNLKEENQFSITYDLNTIQDYNGGFKIKSAGCAEGKAGAETDFWIKFKVGCEYGKVASIQVKQKFSNASDEDVDVCQNAKVKVEPLTSGTYKDGHFMTDSDKNQLYICGEEFVNGGSEYITNAEPTTKLVNISQFRPNVDVVCVEDIKNFEWYVNNRDKDDRPDNDECTQYSECDDWADLKLGRVEIEVGNDKDDEKYLFKWSGSFDTADEDRYIGIGSLSEPEKK